MPKLWTRTIEAHRRDVRNAIVETAAELVTRHGITAVTMSQIADETGIGRATLYKYFPDVEAIVVAWHQRHVTRHLQQLTEIRDRSADPRERLEAVLDAYAVISFERAREHDGSAHAKRRHRTGHAGATHAHHASAIAALVHRSEHVAAAQRQLLDFLRDLLIAAAKTGAVRNDIPADELAGYCLGALDAAGNLPSQAAVGRLVRVTLAGLRSAKG